MKSVKTLTGMICILALSVPLTACDSMREAFGYSNEPAPSSSYNYTSYSKPNAVVTTTERNSDGQMHKKKDGVTMEQPGISNVSTPSPNALSNKKTVSTEAPMVTGPAPTVGQ